MSTLSQNFQNQLTGQVTQPYYSQGQGYGGQITLGGSGLGLAGQTIQTSYPYYYIQNQYFLTVRQIENGWIVNKDGKEYVMTEPQDILEFFLPKLPE